MGRAIPHEPLTDHEERTIFAAMTPIGRKLARMGLEMLYEQTGPRSFCFHVRPISDEEDEEEAED